MSTLTASIEHAPHVTSGALETLPEMPRNGATCDIDTSALKRALTRIKPVTSTRTGRAALAGVRLFCGADGNAYLEATDLIVAGRLLLPEAVIARGFDVLLPAREFQRALKDAAKGTRALLTIAAKEREVTLKVGPVTHSLAESPRDDFPTLDLNPPSDVIVQSTGAALGKAVMRAAVFASKDKTRPVLTGVYITPRSGGRVVGCDSYRLDVAPLNGVQADAFGELGGFNVPAGSLVLALKGASKGNDATGPVTLSITETGLLAIIDRPGECWTIRTIDGQYPNYSQLLPEESPGLSRFTLPTAPFLAAVSGGASVLTGNAPIRLKFSKDDPEMRVTGYVPGVTEYQTTVAGMTADQWGYEGNALEIGMNPGFLRDTLALQDGEKVTVDVSSPLRPVMFRDDSGAVSLIMSVRVNV